MKFRTYLCAVGLLSITFVEAFLLPDPTTHKNWNLVNHDNCGIQNNHIEQRQLLISFVRDANIGEHPWVVSVYIQNPAVGDVINHTNCMGAIITDRHVLSASSCFNKFGSQEVPYHSVRVRVGELDKGTNPDCSSDNHCAPKYNEYEIAKVTYHSGNGYAEDGMNIALLTTDRQMEFNSYVAPLCLEHGDLMETDYGGQLGIKLSGWGKNNDSNVEEKKLKQARVLVLTEEENTQVFNQLRGSFLRRANRESSFCVGQTGGESRHDTDIGGPFMMERAVGSDRARMYLVGILSFSTDRVNLPQHGVPDVYVKVKFFWPWILDQIDPDLLPTDLPHTS
ncbi:spaetzle-processing enzyme-like isoform X2 [Nilaparvata lugens]|uniref:spaetzle-processing enzyme-like isoform X2 n=1 Tax=Nilaparvata lugens TaxID=108931 RepID=UPI00193C89DE|nr:spaetzle-processing enzyme-like isoform X2 [Nilaparvata lugens]